MGSMDEYKSLIDELVERSSSTKAEWVKKGQFPNTAENEAINKVLSSLSTEQRNVIADLVNDAKSSGVHDTLAYLSELQNLNNLKISINQSELPVEPFGTELNFDYTARQPGDEWPEL
ncbi:hypothetical protein J7384_19155 [Endozoicomonas sp. G2_1]|uniref:DUF6547 family protein n=1 Tax=Endozoicomonas sp. G2_1 TaxID=2821091 RepID=UPI001ADB49D9|nr:DUF6547 family protein [Endozoicomonas sp. G2_1]MBO9492473.1 hypothetical protein [Endozoicomonas sp. G2_1]